MLAALPQCVYTLEDHSSSWIPAGSLTTRVTAVQSKSVHPRSPASLRWSNISFPSGICTPHSFARLWMRPTSFSPPAKCKMQVCAGGYHAEWKKTSLFHGACLPYQSGGDEACSARHEYPWRGGSMCWQLYISTDAIKDGQGPRMWDNTCHASLLFSPSTLAPGTSGLKWKRLRAIFSAYMGYSCPGNVLLMNSRTVSLWLYTIFLQRPRCQLLLRDASNTWLSVACNPCWLQTAKHNAKPDVCNNTSCSEMLC